MRAVTTGANCLKFFPSRKGDALITNFGSYENMSGGLNKCRYFVKTKLDNSEETGEVWYFVID